LDDWGGGWDFLDEEEATAAPATAPTAAAPMIAPAPGP